MSKVKMTVTVEREHAREIMRAFRALRADEDYHPRKRGGFPMRDPDERVALAWFLEAALLNGALRLEEEGPG